MFHDKESLQFTGGVSLFPCLVNEVEALDMHY